MSKNLRNQVELVVNSLSINNITIQAPQNVTYTWTLPTALGTNGQVLSTNGNGVLTWSDVNNIPGGSYTGTGLIVRQTSPTLITSTFTSTVNNTPPILTNNDANASAVHVGEFYAPTLGNGNSTHFQVGRSLAVANHVNLQYRHAATDATKRATLKMNASEFSMFGDSTVPATLNCPLGVTGTLTVSAGLAASTIGTNALNVTSLTASQAVFTDASKNLVSVATTGTGSVVLSSSPTISGTLNTSNLNVSGLTASQAVFTNASKNLVSVTTTGSGNVVLSTSASLTTPFIGDANSSSLIVGSNTTISVQGGHFQWNRGGQGETWILNQRGGGTGAIVLGRVTSGNSATAQLTIEENNNATFLGAIICPLYNCSNFTANTVLTASAGKNITSLATGTDGQVLTQVSGAPAWAAVSVPSIIGSMTSVSATANQSIPVSASFTSLTFASGTQNNWISIGSPGFTYAAGVFTNDSTPKTVLISLSVVTATNTTRFEVRVFVGGTQRSYDFFSPSTVTRTLSINLVSRVLASQTIYADARHADGAGVNVLGGGVSSESTRIQITVLNT